jgi:hypothetical protein
MGSDKPHISYSSLMLFLANRYAWDMKYRQGIPIEGTGLSAAIGIAFHIYMQHACIGSPMTHSELVEHAVAHFDATNDIKFDAETDIEKQKEDARRKIADLCGYGRDFIENGMREDLLVATDSEVHFLTRPKGVRMDIQGVMDAVGYWENAEGRLPVVIDWKSVRALSDEPEPQHDIQASVYAMAHREMYGTLPSAVLFIQFKASKNRDGSPQHRILTFLPSEKKPEMDATKRLLNRVIREMGKKHSAHLPNLRDAYGAKESWAHYVTSKPNA